MRNKDRIWEDMDHMLLKGDIVITDPCYLCKEWGKREEVIAWIKRRGLVSQTFYGDWGCTVFRVDKNSFPGHVHENMSMPMGDFTADAGLVCVMKLSDALELRPDFEEWLKERMYCATIIRGFDGTVSFWARKQRRWYMFNGKRQYYTDTELHVRGSGHIDGCPEWVVFESMQVS